VGSHTAMDSGAANTNETAAGQRVRRLDDVKISLFILTCSKKPIEHLDEGDQRDASGSVQGGGTISFAIRAEFIMRQLYKFSKSLCISICSRFVLSCCHAWRCMFVMVRVQVLDLYHQRPIVGSPLLLAYSQKKRCNRNVGC